MRAKAVRVVPKSPNCHTAQTHDRHQGELNITTPPPPSSPHAPPPPLDEPEDDPTDVSEGNDEGGARFEGDEELIEEERWPGPLDSNQTAQASNAPLPRATLPNLILAQQLIDAIKIGDVRDDIRDPERLHSLNNPPTISPAMDAITTLSIKIFEALVLGSQKMYDSIRDALLLPTYAFN